MTFLRVSVVVLSLVLLAKSARAQVDANDLLNLGKELLNLPSQQQEVVPPSQPPPQVEPAEEVPLEDVPAENVPADEPQTAKQNAPAENVAAIVEAQKLLNNLGYDAGPVDGVMGAKTRLAIEEFQQDNLLTVTGRVDDGLLATLRAEAADAGGVATATAAPSFDCALAGTATEEAICASDELAALDRGIADAYAQRLSTATGAERTQLKTEQKAWLAERNVCSGYVPCLSESMTARLASLQEEALALGNAAAAAGTADADSGDSADLAADAQDYAALARQHELVLLKGMPLVAAERRWSEEELAALGRFFDLIEVGLFPDLIELNPVCWAREHLPPHESGKYLDSGTEAYNSAWKQTIGSELLAWKGENEFAAERSKQAFLDAHADELRGMAVTLPLEVLVVEAIQLGRYDATIGGFQLPTFKWLNENGLSFDSLATHGSTTAQMLCGGRWNYRISFPFWTPATNLPEVWRIDAARAEKILETLPDREIYVALTLRLSKMQNAELEVVGSSIGFIRTWSEVTEIAVYGDENLEKLIDTLPIVSGGLPVTATGVPDAAPFPRSLPIDGDSMALLLLRDHGDILGADAWQQFLLRQSRMDQAYYRRPHEGNYGSSEVSWTGTAYDENYVPFFPNGYSVSSGERIPESIMTAFKTWAMRRADNLPTDMILWVRAISRDNEPVRLELPVVDAADTTAAVQALQKTGLSVEQILRPDAMDGGTNDPFTGSELAGEDTSRAPALVLPNIAAVYQPEFTDAERRAIFGGDSGYGEVYGEMIVEVGKSVLLPAEDGSEVFAVEIVPKRVEFATADGSGIAFETTYDVDTLDPARSDATAAAVVTPPEGESVPLSAETVDLLVVRHLPQQMKDSDYRAMMLARWAYEAAIPPDKGEPLWGRFFVPGKPPLSEEQQTALLAGFKDWTLRRAAALPEKITMRYERIPNGDGKPVSPEAAIDSINPNAEATIVSTCGSQAVSYPALTTACEYLKNVLTNAPKIYPFLRGQVQAGPRFDCAEDVYCHTRKSQYEQVSLGGDHYEPGFRDVFVFDKEFYFTGSQSEYNTYLGNYAVMEVDVAVAGMRVADAPLPKPFHEALRRVNEYRRSLGLKEEDYYMDGELPPLTYLVFDAKVLTARIVDPPTGTPQAELELREPRTVSADVLQAPTGPAFVPGEPFGPDVVGLRLGMTFADAEAVIREHMTVGRVLTMDRAHEVRSATGNFDLFSSTKIFVAADDSEFIIIYDEPPAVAGVVLGITRQVNFPRGKLSAATVLAQMRKKYGPESWTGEHGNVAWGEADRFTIATNDYLSHPCVAPNGNQSASNWREADGATTTWIPKLSAGSGGGVPVMTRYESVAGRVCGPVVGMTFSASNDPMLDDRLLLHLIDMSLYSRKYDESKALIESGAASFVPAGEVDAAPEIKL